MSPRRMGPAGGPRPEQLAAYVDGELDPADRAEVDAWLAQHPESAAEVEALRSLARLWQSAAPPEPSETRWARALAGIEAGLSAATSVVSARRRQRLWGLVALATAAAAVVLAVLLSRPAPVVPPGEETEPLPVVSADDVEIISMHTADARALVIGAPPMGDSFDLLGPGEASVEDVKGDMEGMDPYYSRDAAPMIIMMPRDEEP
jgi:anti-sigma-K factor RskA